ncbi:DUF2523 domain-containing protein [Comamonas sp. lk]|uniref:DUF2523 domain-containing protein n=1 Tax=Comamonas sp. lk TaxID=2201272 RepID=UPI000EB51101|nr:DUF2523 domain-containing protein [Comamonas sp. lk]
MSQIISLIIKFALIRFLISIGVGVVTYTAVIVAINNFLSYAKAAYNSMPVQVLNFLAIAGVPEVLGILTGAVIARVSLQFVKRLAFIGG